MTLAVVTTVQVAIVAGAVVLCFAIVCFAQYRTTIAELRRDERKNEQDATGRTERATAEHDEAVRQREQQ
jgi:flagellar biosynthesis/type III secretory pathway M-ring protein FliF/YscJ